jgi:hypothetical protein
MMEGDCVLLQVPEGSTVLIGDLDVMPPSFNNRTSWNQYWDVALSYVVLDPCL